MGSYKHHIEAFTNLHKALNDFGITDAELSIAGNHGFVRNIPGKTRIPLINLKYPHWDNETNNSEIFYLKYSHKVWDFIKILAEQQGFLSGYHWLMNELEHSKKDVGIEMMKIGEKGLQHLLVNHAAMNIGRILENRLGNTTLIYYSRTGFMSDCNDSHLGKEPCGSSSRRDSLDGFRRDFFLKRFDKGANIGGSISKTNIIFCSGSLILNEGGGVTIEEFKKQLGGSRNLFSSALSIGFEVITL